MKTILALFVATTLASTLAHANKLNPSVYFITEIDPSESNCSSMKNLVDNNGAVLAKICPDQYKQCVLEGTCLIVEEDKSTLINYMNMIKGIPRFAKIDSERCPYGLGVNQICLDPYYTVAADLKYHKAGDVLFVEKLKGVKLPNGEIHNGYVIVRDRGGAIQGPNRFDFFTGTLHYTDPENTISKQGFSSSNNSYSYQIIKGSKAEEVRKSRNFPLIPKDSFPKTNLNQ